VWKGQRSKQPGCRVSHTLDQIDGLCKLVETDLKSLGLLEKLRDRFSQLILIRQAIQLRQSRSRAPRRRGLRRGRWLFALGCRRAIAVLGQTDLKGFHNAWLGGFHSFDRLQIGFPENALGRLGLG